VNIDIKEEQPGVEVALLETIKGAGAGDRVLVVSEMPAVVERVRELSGNASRPAPPGRRSETSTA
jgi:hypothetical protein